MKNNINFNYRKIFQILFFASIFFEIVYFTCKPLLYVEFRYYSAIFYFVFVTLLSGCILVPKKKILRWVLYPIIVLALLMNTLILNRFNEEPDYTITEISPHYKSILIIEERLGWDEPYLTTYSFYAVKGIIFKKKIHDDMISSALDIENLTWIDDYNVKFKYLSDSSRIENDVVFFIKLSGNHNQ